MPSNDTSPSRFLAVRGLFFPARRAIQFLLGRLPAPAQQLGATALNAAAARWPVLSRLLGLSGPTATPFDAGPSRASDLHPASTGGAPASDDAGEAGATARRRLEHLTQLREASDYGERSRAALALARMSDPETTAALVAALRDPSAEVASSAAEALTFHPSEAATSSLRRVLENRDGYFSGPTRASAVRALGTLLPANEGMPIAGAVHDLDALVSLAAIAALAERDESESTGALMGVLEDRTGFYLPLTRQAAARALRRLKHYDRDRLHGVLAAEYDEAVREELSSLAN